MIRLLPKPLAKVDVIAARLRDSLRGSRPRARTENIGRLPKSELRRVHLELVRESDEQRPRTRGECIDGERPCPWISCRHHLALDVNDRNGSIKTNFPDIEVEDMPETCSLDVADEGGATLERVASALNLVRERVRQLEVIAMAKVGPRVRRLLKGSL